MDENGREVEIVTPWREEYRPLRRGMILETLIASKSKFYGDVYNIADAYVPDCKVWIGDFPYLNRRYFRRLCEDVFPETSSKIDDPVEWDFDRDDDGDLVSSANVYSRGSESSLGQSG